MQVCLLDSHGEAVLHLCWLWEATSSLHKCDCGQVDLYSSVHLYLILCLLVHWSMFGAHSMDSHQLWTRLSSMVICYGLAYQLLIDALSIWSGEFLCRQNGTLWRKVRKKVWLFMNEWRYSPLKTLTMDDRPYLRPVYIVFLMLTCC